MAFDQIKQPLAKLDFKVLINEISRCFTDLRILQDNGPDDPAALVCNHQMEFGDAEPVDIPVMVIAGINASGKSVMASVVSLTAKECGYACRSVSMANRTSSGFARAAVFGDESDGSTGVNSVSAVLKGIQASMIGEGPAVMILDEPDIGLSEEYAGAMGEYIASKVTESNHNLKLVVVVSHSRPLYRRLLEVLPYRPHSAIMGDKDMTFQQWLDSPVPRFGIEDLEKLKQKGRDTWRAIHNKTKDN